MKRSAHFGVIAATAIISATAVPALTAIADRGQHGRPSECPNSPAQRARNEATVRGFYETAVNDNDPALAVELYVGLDENGDKLYTQHNPFAGDGVEPFIDFFTNVFPNGDPAGEPDGTVEIFRIVSECDLVVTHSRINEGFGDIGFGEAAIDIFRIDDDGKIVEHWDAVQTVPHPDDRANDNGMF